LKFSVEFGWITESEKDDSRKDARGRISLSLRRKGAKNKKFEARNPKSETISNDQNTQNSKQASFRFGVLDFPDLRFICL
jgi:hypothetical protein